MNKTLLGIGALVLVVVALIGFSRTSSPAQQTANHATSPQVAAAATDIALQSLDGTTIKLSDYKGKKPVVLDFFATWCPNCQRNMPHVSALYSQYKDKVEIIGVDLQEEKSLVQKFVQQYGVTYPVVLDPSGTARDAFQVQYTNVQVLIDKNGNVVRTIPGDLQESDLKSLL